MKKPSFSQVSGPQRRACDFCYAIIFFMSIPSPERITVPPPLTAEQLAARRESQRRQRNIIALVSLLGILVLTLLGAAVWLLLRPDTPAEAVGRIRDVFIIVVALESLLIGVAMIVLIVQVASLINLVQNEVRPILHATSETVNNLRGTAAFLGENVVEPVIRLNGYLAGLNRMIELMGIRKR